jgi:hypothetical protein
MIVYESPVVAQINQMLNAFYGIAKLSMFNLCDEKFQSAFHDAQKLCLHLISKNLSLAREINHQL